MLVTLAGNEIVVSAEQPAKQDKPIDFRFLPKETEDRFVQFLKADACMDVNASGKIMLRRLLQSWKA
jgi:hypothetical protein